MEPDIFKTDNQLPKKHPYTVPDGYFDKLPMRIQQRVQQEQTARVFWQSPIFSRPVLRYAVAAVLVLATAVGLLLNRFTPANQPNNAIALSELTDAEVSGYLAANYYQLEPADVAAIATAADLPTVQLPALEPADLADEIDYATLEEYYL